jgi:hypothetical protein
MGLNATQLDLQVSACLPAAGGETMSKEKRSAEQQVADEVDLRALNPNVSKQAISDRQAIPEFQENHKLLCGSPPNILPLSKMITPVA